MKGVINGAEGIRTLDFLHAMQALSQLSYGPNIGFYQNQSAIYTAWLQIPTINPNISYKQFPETIWIKSSIK